MRPIDADELHNELKKQPRWVVKREGFTNEGYSYDQVHFTIDKMPTVEAEPVRHGRWIDHKYKEFPIGRYECSVCGAKHDMEWDYCPNCGVKMYEGDIT